MTSWSERTGQNTEYIKKWPLIPQGLLIYRCCVNHMSHEVWVTLFLAATESCTAEWEFSSLFPIYHWWEKQAWQHFPKLLIILQKVWVPREWEGEKKILMKKKGELDSQVMFLYLTFYCKTNIITSNRIFLSLWWVYVPNKDWFYYFIFSSSSWSQAHVILHTVAVIA